MSRDPSEDKWGKIEKMKKLNKKKINL